MEAGIKDGSNGDEALVLLNCLAKAPEEQCDENEINENGCAQDHSTTTPLSMEIN